METIIENGKNINQLISIIIVVLNAYDEMQKTIKSIREQSYKNIEIIVIDGGSGDKTLSYLQDNNGEVDKWKSDIDKGIYDAMNKGMEIASGEWVLFLNGGDVFYDENVVNEIFGDKYDHFDKDILYGDVEILKNEYSYIKKAHDKCKILQQMICCHQSIFFSRRITKTFKYDLNYKICADYDLVMRLYKKGFKFLDLNRVISKFAPGGLSEKKRLKRNFEEYKIIVINNKFSIKIFIAYIRILTISIAIDLAISLGLKEIIDILNKKLKA